jgi:hypothetical protein
MPHYSPEELQDLATVEEPRELEVEIKNQLEGERSLSLEELVNKVEEPKNDIENAVRHLLQRQEIGETADWQFYIAQDQK